MSLRLERRLQTPAWLAYTLPPVSVLLGLLAGGVLVAAAGFNPVLAYTTIFQGAFGSSFSVGQTLVKTVPLVLTGLGVAVAFRMLLWNIGAEGQFYMGAMAATGIDLAFPSLPAPVMLPAMLVAGFAAGAAWGMVPGFLKAYLGVNEIIVSLLLNYVAILFIGYLVYGPWKDPNGHNFPYSALLVPAAQLPTFGHSAVHYGVLIALAAAVAVYVATAATRWGYELRVIGENPRAARYAGINIARHILLAMAISGGLAGMGGMTEISGVIHNLQGQVSSGYGYSAIIVAWLARLNPFAIVLVSLLFGALLIGGYAVETVGIPSDVAFMLQGSILFFVLGGEVLYRYRLRLVRSGRPTAEEGG